MTGDPRRFVALLRAVNVAGTTIAMAELRRRLEGIGFADVQTYVQSGNVVFSADGAVDEVAAAIGGLIAREFGYEVGVLVLSAEEMAAIVAGNPFLSRGVDKKALHTTFLFAPVGEAGFAGLALPARDGEEALPAGRVVYLYLPHGYGRSKLTNAYFERVLRTPATTRNWRTTVALAALAASVG